MHPDLGTLASFRPADSRGASARHPHRARPGAESHLGPASDGSSSRDPRATNPKRDWYIWHRGRNGGPPNNWKSTFGGSAWEFDAASGEWYLHSFLREQPDLNFRNPEVVEAMHDVLRFWLDRGVDGFRVDVIAQMIKDAQFRDNPEVPAGQQLSQLERLAYEQRYSSDQPEVHEHHARLSARARQLSASRMMVGEVWPRDPRSLADYLRPDELQQAFNFRFLFSPWRRTRSAPASRRLSRSSAPRRGRPTRFRITTSLAISRATAPGMPRHARGWRRCCCSRCAARPSSTMARKSGCRTSTSRAERKRDPVGRDGCRTPMQWDASRNGGFTTASEAWLPLGDCEAINVAKQLGDASSMLSLYRRMIHLRKTQPRAFGGQLPHRAERARGLPHLPSRGSE